jgi:hypothetical protein
MRGGLPREQHGGRYTEWFTGSPIPLRRKTAAGFASPCRRALSEFFSCGNDPCSPQARTVLPHIFYSVASQRRLS